MNLQSSHGLERQTAHTRAPLPAGLPQRAQSARGGHPTRSRAVDGVRLPAGTGQLAVESSEAAEGRLPVLNLVAESLAVDAVAQKFETLASRCAMIGFLVASTAEAFTPSHGLFGAVDGQELQQFALAAGLLVTTSALLAAFSKRRVGEGLSGAVLTTLSGARVGIDKQLDRVLETVFSGSVLASLTELDFEDFI